MTQMHDNPAGTMQPPARAEEHGQPFEGGKKRKRRKKKYSRGLKNLQKTEASLTKGGRRLARAVEQGMSNWRWNRDKSSRKKRDGAIRDALKNGGKALSKFTKVAAKIPEDITDSMPRVQRMLRMG